jgi:hypothetical protein
MTFHYVMDFCEEASGIGLPGLSEWLTQIRRIRLTLLQITRKHSIN